MGPYVVLDVDLRGGAFELVLVNIGDEPAHEVCVDLKPRVKALGGELDLASLPLFAGLGVLRPGKEIRVFVDRAARVLEQKSKRFTATVRFCDAQGETQTRSYGHDFGAYRGIPELGAPQASP